MALHALPLLVAAALDPIAAAELATRLAGRPDLLPAMLAICERESKCERIGVHRRDAWVSDSSWGGQVQLGHLDPTCQPRGRGKRWGTRVVAGLNAAAHWPYLPPCYAPEVLDTPIVSWVVAIRKYVRRCEGERRGAWCPRAPAADTRR